MIYTKYINGVTELFFNCKKIDNIDDIKVTDRIKFMTELKERDAEYFKNEVDYYKAKGKKQPCNEIEQKTLPRNKKYIYEILDYEGIKIKCGHVIKSRNFQYALSADLILLTSKDIFILIDFKPTEKYLDRLNYLTEIRQNDKPGYSVAKRKCKPHYLSFIDDCIVAFMKISHNNRTVLNEAYEDGTLELTKSDKVKNDTNYDNTKKVDKECAMIGIVENSKIFNKLDKTVYCLEFKNRELFRINKTIYLLTPEKLATQLNQYIELKKRILFSVNHRLITTNEIISAIEEFANVKIQEPECKIIAMNYLENLYIKDKVTCKNILLWQRDMLLLSMINCVSIKEYWSLLKETAYKNITIK